MIIKKTKEVVTGMLLHFFKTYFIKELEPEPGSEPVKKMPGVGTGQKRTGSANNVQDTGIWCDRIPVILSFFNYKKYFWRKIHLYNQCCGAGAGGAKINLGPGAENKFQLNIFCSQFGGC